MGGGPRAAAGAGGGGVRNILGARARVTKRLGSASASGGGGGGGKGNTSNGVMDSFAASEGPEGRSTGGDVTVEGEGNGDGAVEEVVVAEIRREDDFQGWLSQQKAGWRRHREESKLKRRSEARSQVQQQ